MVVNAAGQTLLLALSNIQFADLTRGLNPGDSLRARVLDVLPDQKALLQIRGASLVADLQGSVAQNLQKSDILQLSVKEMAQAPGQQGRTGQLVLQLVEVQAAPLSAKAAPAVSLPSPTPPATFLTLESLLEGLKLPLTQTHLQAARALQDNGLPVTAASIKQLLQDAQALSQGGAANQAGGPASSGPQPSQLAAQAFAPARSLLHILDAQFPPAQRHLQIQEALKLIDLAVEKGNLPAAPPPASLSAAGGLPAPLQPAQPPLPVPTQPSASQTAPASPPPPAAASPAPPLAGAAQVLAGLVAQLGSQPDILLPQLIQVLQNTVARPAAGQQPVVPADKGPQGNFPATPDAGFSAIQAVPPAVVHAVSEALAATLDPRPSAPVASPALAAAVEQAAQELVQPGSTLASRLAALDSPAPQAVASASPGLAASPDSLDVARDLLAQLSRDLRQQPLTQPLQSRQELASLVRESAAPAVPAQTLAGLPTQSVLEALAFLQSRGLPADASLATPVAQTLASPASLVDHLNSLQAGLTLLPPKILAANPGLAKAVLDFQQAFSAAAPDPGKPGLAAQLRSFVQASGLELEARLASEVNFKGAPAPQAAPPPADLKAALLNVQHQARQAVSRAEEDATGASKEAARALAAVASQAKDGLAAMTTLQLANLPQASREMVAVHLPLWFGREITPGQLSVYWKRGREPKLDEAEPLSMVFQIKTGALGQVKVFLQVWKNDCQCRVEVASEDTRAHFARYLDDLKAGFNANTPFQLNSIDLKLASGERSQFLPGLDAVPAAAGLDLSA